MSWFKKIALIKTAQLRGEWFLDDNGDATFADGDIGDYNHEAYALQVKIPDELYPKYENGTLSPEERFDIGEDFLKFMENGGEAREWMVLYEGWIRVHGHNFELYSLDRNKLDNILNFIYEQVGDITENNDFDIYIEDLNTGKTYDFSANQLKEAGDQPGGLERLLMRGTLIPGYSETQRGQNVQDAQNTQNLDDGQGMFDFKD